MAAQGTRKLAVILMGDMVGYSRLMGSDERGTVNRVEDLFVELINPTIVEHRGYLVGTRGDGFLAVFDSPVEAVRCAIVIQQSMIGRNLELPQKEWIRFRIGVNLGDVIVQDDNVQGEGVNIAARLEGIAEPGAIFISGGVYEFVRTKLVCGYQSLGEKRVKNITDPIAVYRVLPDPSAVARIDSRSRYRRMAIGGVLGLVVLGGGGALYMRRGNDVLDTATATQHLDQTVPAPIGKGKQASSPPGPMLRPAVGGASYSDQPEDAKTQPQQAAQTPQVVQPEQKPPPSPVPREPPPEQQQVAIAPPRPEPPRPTPILPPITPPPSQPQISGVSQPEMVFLTGGSFVMGSQEDPSERPVHRVNVIPFFIGKYPVTGKEWHDCVVASGCRDTTKVDSDAPISNVSWNDAEDYVKWLAQATKLPYRLPTEAEWEYAARGGTETRFWWGNSVKYGVAVCKDCGDAMPPTKVGKKQANPFGVFDIGGGVSEWVEDCWFKDYNGAPSTSIIARQMAACRDHVLRGGSWRNDSSYLRSSSRDYYDSGVRYPTHGFRVARSQ